MIGKTFEPIIARIPILYNTWRDETLVLIVARILRGVHEQGRKNLQDSTSSPHCWKWAYNKVYFIRTSWLLVLGFIKWARNSSDTGISKQILTTKLYPTYKPVYQASEISICPRGLNHWCNRKVRGVWNPELLMSSPQSQFEATIVSNKSFRRQKRSRDKVSETWLTFPRFSFEVLKLFMVIQTCSSLGEIIKVEMRAIYVTTELNKFKGLIRVIGARVWNETLWLSESSSRLTVNI